MYIHVTNNAVISKEIQTEGGRSMKSLPVLPIDIKQPAPNAVTMCRALFKLIAFLSTEAKIIKKAHMTRGREIDPGPVRIILSWRLIMK